MSKYHQEHHMPSLLPEQWAKQIDKITSKCDDACSFSRDLRERAVEFGTEAESSIFWRENRTKASITASIEEIQRWLTILEKCHSELDLEISSVQATLSTIEQTEDDTTPILSVTRECISLREQRKHPDDVRDRVYHQLESEVNLLHNICCQLRKASDELTNLLAKLRASKMDVEEVVRSKRAAKEIEESQLNLGPNSSGISLKPPIIIAKRAVPEQNWQRSSSELHSCVLNLMRHSWTVRLSCQSLCKDSGTRVRTQREAVNYELRKRVHDFERAILQLEWRETKLGKEIEEAERVYSQLEKTYRGNIEPLKVGETRMGNRALGPQKDLSGVVQDAIGAQVDAIRQTRHNLREMTENLACEMTALENHLRVVKDTLSCKRNSLSLDQKCLLLRNNLTSTSSSRHVPSDINLVPSPLFPQKPFPN